MVLIVTPRKHKHRWGKWHYTKTRRQRIRVCGGVCCPSYLQHQQKNHEGRYVDR